MVPVDLDVLKKGLRSIHKDFEDAIQMICASSIPGINYIVTRNTKDFKTSELVVLTPDEMCLKKVRANGIPPLPWHSRFLIAVI